MDVRTKYRIATAVLVVGAGLTFYGFNRVQSEAFGGHISPAAVILLFSGAIMGISAGIYRRYWHSRLESSDGQKIALRILGELGRQKIEKKKIGKNN